MFLQAHTPAWRRRGSGPSDDLSLLGRGLQDLALVLQGETEPKKLSANRADVQIKSVCCRSLGGTILKEVRRVKNFTEGLEKELKKIRGAKPRRLPLATYLSMKKDCSVQGLLVHQECLLRLERTFLRCRGGGVTGCEKGEAVNPSSLPKKPTGTEELKKGGSTTTEVSERRRGSALYENAPGLSNHFKDSLWARERHRREKTIATERGKFHPGKEECGAWGSNPLYMTGVHEI